MLTHILRLATLAAVLGAWDVALEPRQSPAAPAELRAAVDREAVDGDVAGAIKAYQAIVERYSATDRVVAATALLRLAQAYQRLGDAQARAAYERLVREFGDVGELVATARARLSSLNAARRSIPSLTMRRVYSGPGLDWCNGLSSDVRYLSHPDWNTGNIAVADLRDGSVRPVTTAGGIGQGRSGEFGECTIFSPDDRQIAYYWDSRSATELRVVTLDGSKPRTIYKSGPEKPYLRPLDWSRDGRLILAELSPERTTQLVAIATADGAVRVLKDLGEWPGNLDGQFSADGRYVAYAARQSKDSTRRDVFVMANDGSGDRAVVRHPADDRLLGWTPDGESLLFASDRTGSNGVWSVGIEKGRPVSAPSLVKADLGAITPIRFLNGTLFYALGSQMSEIHLSDVDPVSGKAVGTSTPAKPDFTGSNAKPDWSPDGTSLAYIAFRGTAGHPAAPEHIGILDLRTRTERRIRPALEQLEPFGSGPDWSPDGRSLLVIARQQTPQHGLYVVDAQTGATTRVKSAVGHFLLHAVWGRDGKSVFYTIGGGCSGQGPCPHRIVRHDLATGEERELASLPGAAGFPKLAASPDGSWLAFTWRVSAPQATGLVSVVPTGGGPARELFRSLQTSGPGFIAWAPDGRHIYFTRQGELWRVTADGSHSELVEALVPRGRGWFSFSPDGRRIAFTMGESTSELWALENLVTPARR